LKTFWNRNTDLVNNSHLPHFKMNQHHGVENMSFI
jgi:hypothetical protein